MSYITFHTIVTYVGPASLHYMTLFYLAATKETRIRLI